MAVPVALQTIGFRDVQGRIGHTKAYIRGAADANAQAALSQDWINKVDAIAAHLGLDFAHGPVSSAQAAPNYGVAGVFQSVLDKARMVFFDTAGAVHRYEIPGPLGTIFRPDSVTVDQAFGIVSAYIVAVQTDLASKGGQNITFFAGGVRVERHLPRRPGILVLDSSLTPGQPAE